MNKSDDVRTTPISSEEALRLAREFVAEPEKRATAIRAIAHEIGPNTAAMIEEAVTMALYIIAQSETADSPSSGPGGCHVCSGAPRRFGDGCMLTNCPYHAVPSGMQSESAESKTRELLEHARLALEACTGPADCCGMADNGQREWPLKMELLSRIQAHLDTSPAVVAISTDLSQCKPEDFQHE